MIRYLFICIVLAQLIAGCNRAIEPGYNFNDLLDAYGTVWNTGDLDPLDSLVSVDFEFRYNSSGPATGIEPLVGAIQATRQPFTDFELALIDQRPAGDNVCLITWEITGKKKADGEAFRSVGFSVIFHEAGKITGEWISYSDIEWATGIGYQLIPPGG
jgi:hypothetical protein